MNYKRLRVIASGFSDFEYDLYRLDDLDRPEDALKFLSQQSYVQKFRPKLNGANQKYCLEDKWMTYCYLNSLGVATSSTIGLFHPQFGVSSCGKPMTCADDFSALLNWENPQTLFFKPRGGRQARNVFVVTVSRRTGDGALIAKGKEGEQLLEDFLTSSLPSDAYEDYDGSYHGWLVQGYIHQHSFLATLNPHSVNTVRVVTYLDIDNSPQILACVLKLGREGTDVDAWSTGGLSVAVSVENGKLGFGRLKPEFGKENLSVHPDTQAQFYGEILPFWDEIESLVKRATLMYTGVRTVGWDVAITADGPEIVEGNVDWSLSMIQVHSDEGLLTPSFRDDLAKLGVNLPDSLPGFLRNFYVALRRGWWKFRG